MNSLKPDDLKYYSMYCNIDRMLKKLPEAVVEDLNMEILQLVHIQLKKHDPEVVVHCERID